MFVSDTEIIAWTERERNRERKQHSWNSRKARSLNPDSLQRNQLLWNTNCKRCIDRPLIENSTAFLRNFVPRNVSEFHFAQKGLQNNNWIGILRKHEGTTVAATSGHIRGNPGHNFDRIAGWIFLVFLSFSRQTSWLHLLKHHERLLNSPSLLNLHKHPIISLGCIFSVQTVSLNIVQKLSSSSPTTVSILNATIRGVNCAI
jgi:hypothetical protein